MGRARTGIRRVGGNDECLFIVTEATRNNPVPKRSLADREGARAALKSMA